MKPLTLTLLLSLIGCGGSIAPTTLPDGGPLPTLPDAGACGPYVCPVPPDGGLTVSYDVTLTWQTAPAATACGVVPALTQCSVGLSVTQAQQATIVGEYPGCDIAVEGPTVYINCGCTVTSCTGGLQYTCPTTPPAHTGPGCTWNP